MVNSHACIVGNERDENNNVLKWVLPYKNPCKCTSVSLGGTNTWTPVRYFAPFIAESPIVSDDIIRIRTHFGLDCDEESKLMETKKC